MPKPLLLTDDDVIQFLTPTEALAVMENIFLARSTGEVDSVPRWEMPFPEGKLVFTVGSVPQGVGFRTYLTGRFAHNDQLVAVWDRDSGELKGVVVGAILGALRTGAIGGVALKYMARGDVLAIIGTGRQAYFQLRAAVTLQQWREVRVFSRTQEHLLSFCQDMRQLIPNMSIIPAESVEHAVRGADVIISATNSREPVIKGAWLSENAHLTTVGPKGKSEREIDEDAVSRASFIVTDSPEQMKAYPSIIEGKKVHDLSELVSGKIKPASGISLFVSAGLAGTEVALAARLIQKISAHPLS